MERQVVVVFGATGAQGKGVVAGLLLGTKKWLIRAVTREPASEKAQALSQLAKIRSRGHPDTTLELVKAEFGDEETLRTVLKGADGVFLNMDFWTLGREKEVQYGKQVADLISSTSATAHVVYSGLEHVSKLTEGKLECSFYDSKGEVTDYLRDKLSSVTVVKYSTYMENFLGGHTALTKEKWDDEGGECVVFAFPIPEDVGVTLVPVHDVGRVIASIFEDMEKKWVGRHAEVGLAGDHLTGKQMADIFERVCGGGEGADGDGKKLHARAQMTSLEAVKARNLQGGNMWEFKIGHEQLFAAYVEQSRAIVPDLQSFEEWLQQHKNALLSL